MKKLLLILLCVAMMAGPAFGGLLFYGLFSLRPPASRCYQIEVNLQIEHRSVCFMALVDTCNRLREPVSGQPVLIAEAALLKGSIPGCQSLEMKTPTDMAATVVLLAHSADDLRL